MKSTKAEAEALFAALRNSAGENQQSFEEYEEQRYSDALTTVLVDAYVILAQERGWPNGWPRWPDAQNAIDYEETRDLLIGWVENQLDRAGLLPQRLPEQAATEAEAGA
jgi:hypothetical protein